MKLLDLDFTSASMDDEFGVKKIAPFSSTVRGVEAIGHDFHSKGGGKRQIRNAVETSSRQ